MAGYPPKSVSDATLVEKQSIFSIWRKKCTVVGVWCIQFNGWELLTQSVPLSLPYSPPTPTCIVCLPHTPEQACRNPGMLDNKIPAVFHFPIISAIVWKCTWSVCKYDQYCLQMSLLAGILNSRIPGLLQAWPNI